MLKFIRNTGFIFLITVLVNWLPSTALASNANDGRSADGRVNLYFIQTALKAQLQKDPQAKDSYILTLQGINDWVDYIADRPIRLQGTVSLADFVDEWGKGPTSFAKDNPNVVITYVIGSNKGITDMNSFAAVLSNPQYDAKNDTLTYHLKHLENEREKVLDGNYHSVSIFIDC